MNEATRLWSLSAEMMAVVERWLYEHEQKVFYTQRMPRIDRLRLTRLQVWAWRHKVSVEDVLTLTLPYLRKSTSGVQRRGFGLGVSIAALTGRGNEKILIEAIRQKYPEGEHLAAWRQQEQLKQLAAEAAEENEGLALRTAAVRGPLDFDRVEDFLQSYRARVVRDRMRLRTEQSDPRRRRKRYGGNPWL